jgi:hypothetical protein
MAKDVAESERRDFANSNICYNKQMKDVDSCFGINAAETDPAIFCKNRNMNEPPRPEG